MARAERVKRLHNLRPLSLRSGLQLVLKLAIGQVLCPNFLLRHGFVFILHFKNGGRGGELLGQRKVVYARRNLLLTMNGLLCQLQLVIRGFDFRDFIPQLGVLVVDVFLSSDVCLRSC